jgi:hypothetical protein
MPEGLKRDNPGLRRQLILVKNSGLYFVTMHLHVFRGFNAEADLSALGPQYHDPDIGPDGHSFSPSSCKDQHSNLPQAGSSLFYRPSTEKLDRIDYRR